MEPRELTDILVEQKALKLRVERLERDVEISQIRSIIIPSLDRRMAEMQTTLSEMAAQLQALQLRLPPLEKQPEVKPWREDGFKSESDDESDDDGATKARPFDHPRCSVCKRNPRDSIVFPCHHQICAGCVGARCPLCHCIVDKSIKFG